MRKVPIMKYLAVKWNDNENKYLNWFPLDILMVWINVDIRMHTIRIKWRRPSNYAVQIRNYRALRCIIQVTKILHTQTHTHIFSPTVVYFTAWVRTQPSSHLWSHLFCVNHAHALIFANTAAQKCTTIEQFPEYCRFSTYNKHTCRHKIWKQTKKKERKEKKAACASWTNHSWKGHFLFYSAFCKSICTSLLTLALLTRSSLPASSCASSRLYKGMLFIGYGDLGAFHYANESGFS